VSQIKNLDVVSAAIANGVNGFVWKMDAAAELSLGIETVLRGKRFFSRGVRAQIPMAEVDRSAPL